MDTIDHPCQKCGACCTTYQVAFHRKETHPESFQVPIDLTFKSSADHLAMKQRNYSSSRCIALEGNVGRMVSCRVYDNRPSPCRNFKASYEDGVPNRRCDECRVARGLQPLTPEDWQKL